MNPGQLYRPRDQRAASLLIDRINKLNEHRLATTPAQAVIAADQIHGLLDAASHEELRAAVVWLTSPETRPVLPVVPGAAVDELEAAYRDSPGFRERGW